MAETKMRARRTVKKVEADVQTGDVLNVEGLDTTIEDKGSDTVCVLLNYPRDVKYMVPDNHGVMRPLVFKGNATHLKGKMNGVLPTGGAFGITAGVPREAWEWLVKHRPKDPLIAKGYLFVAEAQNARAAAKERKDMRNGFEPVDPKRAASRPN